MLQNYNIVISGNFSQENFDKLPKNHNDPETQQYFFTAKGWNNSNGLLLTLFSFYHLIQLILSCHMLSLLSYT